MVFTKFAPILALAALASSAAAMPRVDSGVHRTLRQQSTVNLIVTMKAGVDATIDSVKEADFATRAQKIAALVSSLENNAKTTQSSVDKVLFQEAFSSTPMFESEQSFWISNQKAIKGATFELVEKLAGNPDIAEIREAIVLPPPSFNVVDTNSTASDSTIQATNEWGVTKVQAPSVWAAGYNGQGVVVGSIDTGVLATHTSIAANFRSSFGWYDPAAKKATPYDDNGHGTHTIGTIAGLNGIGVAPGAKFISCRGCTNDGCTEEDLLACAQFMTCPTDAAGTVKDCSQAPKIVSNSWGGGQADTFYAAAINTWQAAGIIPVFAIGNTVPGGPRGCGSAASPGDGPNVISVGATDVNDALGSFSLQGPSKLDGALKPEISAPGVNVRSAWSTGTSAFSSISGTSMACPHVSGVIALLLSKNPALTYQQAKDAITGTTDKSLKSGARTCSGIADTVFPNHQFGYGRINAFTAFNKV